MKEKNYEILSENTLVAVWKNSDLTVINEKLLPLFLKRYSQADEWLKERAIDAHRSHSRLLKKALRITNKDDIEVVMYAHGVTITDTYWVREIGSDLSYEDVKITPSTYGSLTANIALTGNYDAINEVMRRKSALTAELTNIGSFEKCWKHLSDGWWMYKSGTNEELFSELFVYRLGKALNFNMAEYRKQGDNVRSKDFTNGASVNFESALTFIGDDIEYENVHEKLLSICPTAIEDYVKMIFLDAITNNVDRHENNFGLLRDVHTGELLSFAPLFDHNLSLISRSLPKILPKNDLLVTEFIQFIKNHNEYKKFIPELKESVLKRIVREISISVKYEKQQIVKLVFDRYNYICKELQNISLN